MEQRTLWQPRELRRFDRFGSAPAVPIAQPKIGDVAARFGRPFIAGHADTVVRACADGRYTIIEWEVLRALGLTRVPDYPLAPGGPGTLHPATNLDPSSRANEFREIEFLVRGHHATRVLLIAHHACGYYAARFSGQPEEWIRDRQLRDLVEVQVDLQYRHPGVQFDCYFAQPEDGHVTIRHVVAE